MEFSRRGRATDNAGDGQRFPDPPPHGDPMMVMRDALLSQLQKDRLRQEIIVAELAKIECVMALHAATGGQQVTPTPASECLTTCEGKVARQNAASDEQRLLDSNEAVPQSKTSVAEKWELTGITIPVKKLKPPMKWNCTVCQVQATSEKNLQMHYAGQKHLANVATLGPGTKPSGQKTKAAAAAAAAQPSLGTEQRKTSSINWSCSTCQVRGTSKSTFDAHLQGKRHQQNIAEASVKGDGDGNGAPKNATAGEAKSDGITVPKPSEKPSQVWSCSICQATCTCEADLKNHLRGARHRDKVQSLLEESKNMTRNPETNLKKNNAPQMVKNQGPHPAWNCTMCQAKCFSKSQFENHCGGSRHQQNIEAILGKRETAKASSSRTANELAVDGSSSKNASSEEAEKKATLYFCEVCNLLCGSSEMLVSHRYGKRHREKLSARK